MGANAVLGTSAHLLSVTPGGDTTCDITIRNDGTVVDTFTVEPLGPTADWIIADPPTTALFPGESGVVVLHVRPPRSAAAPPGLTPFAVRVRSQEDPDGTVVEEGTVDVGTFVDTRAELLARRVVARGRRRGRVELAIDNAGNVPVAVRVRPAAPDGDVDVEPRPADQVVEPDTATIVKVRARSRAALWRGEPRVLPFAVVTEPETEPALVTDAELLQLPVVPKWLAKLLLALLALALLLTALWFAVLRPTIRDAAKGYAADVATKAATKAAGKAASGAATKAAQQAVAPVQAQVDQLATKGGGTGKKTHPVVPVGVPPQLVRLAASPTQQSPSIVLSPTRPSAVSDLLFQNPQGDSGLATLSRDGQVVYVTRLDNFRDLDLHLVTPLEVEPGGSLTLAVNCANKPGPGAAAARPCSPAVTLTAAVGSS